MNAAEATASPVRRRLAELAAVVGAVVIVIWALTGASSFWPAWVLFGLGIPIAFDLALRRAWRAEGRRALAVHAATAAVVGGICVVVWALGPHGYFWPAWPLLGLAIALALHWLLSPRRESRRERELEQRVGSLTESRRDVLEIQAAELRRVERDLHDGAQARLVSLGMSLGMAEDALDADPDEARRLLADARSTAGAALSDLRNLVRGIHPPVLADRGLVGAIEALVATLPVRVDSVLDHSLDTLPAPLESALYFAVAELLANLVKHSGASLGWVQGSRTATGVRMVIGDDGCGGADPTTGSGLAGVAQRLSAFDGTLRVSSPAGGPTVVVLEVPCEPSSPKT